MRNQEFKTLPMCGNISCSGMPWKRCQNCRVADMLQSPYHFRPPPPWIRPPSRVISFEESKHFFGELPTVTTNRKIPSSGWLDVDGFFTEHEGKLCHAVAAPDRPKTPPVLLQCCWSFWSSDPLHPGKISSGSRTGRGNYKNQQPQRSHGYAIGRHIYQDPPKGCGTPGFGLPL